MMCYNSVTKGVTIMSAFAINLRKLRKERGITQAELGKAIGVGKASVSAYEKDGRKPSFEILENIADYFNVNMGDLVGQEDIQLYKVEFFDFDEDVEPIAYSFKHDLNDDGRQALLDYMNFLKSNPKYSNEV